MASLDYKNITKKSIEKALEKLWPKPGDPDYFGPIGNDQYKLGRNGYTNIEGWKLFQKAVSEKLKNG